MKPIIPKFSNKSIQYEKITKIRPNISNERIDEKSQKQKKIF